MLCKTFTQESLCLFYLVTTAFFILTITLDNSSRSGDPISPPAITAVATTALNSKNDLTIEGMIPSVYEAKELFTNEPTSSTSAEAAQSATAKKIKHKKNHSKEIEET